MINEGPQSLSVLGVPISAALFDWSNVGESALQNNKSVLVSFVNPHACYIQKKHSEYAKNLRDLDWVLCDGIGMVRAARLVADIEVDRTAFDLTSIAGPVFEWMAQHDVPVILVGGAQGVADQAADKFRALFPGLEIPAVFSGFDSGPADAMERLSLGEFCCVICGMGAPRQEAFLISAKNAGWRGIGFTCGGFFDQVIDRVNYYPAWVDRLNLRFAYRLLKEPRRLWRRYLVEYQVFMWRLIKALLSRKFGRKAQ